jgi:osmotically-inducible protein OsmY
MLELSNDRRFRYSHIRVTSYNHVVLLSGQATSDDFKAEAAKIAQNTPNVIRVYNELTVAEPSSIADRSRDAFITSKVRTQLLTKKGLESGSIHIVTDNSTVFLMGIATHEQADLAVEATRQVNGVNKVVKIFQYIV